MWQKVVFLITVTTLAGGLRLSTAAAAKPGTWTVINDPGEARELATVTLLQDGRVLIAGGEGYQGVLNLVEIFDPKTDTYKKGHNLSVQRVQATATLLTDGTVLVVGGTSDNLNPQPLKSAEIYNPKTKTWTATGSLNQARFGHEATLLQDGRVLVMGGTPDTETQLKSCEIWDPKTGQWTYTGAMSYGRRYSNAATLSNGDVLEAGDGVRSEVYSVAAGTWSFTKAEPTLIYAMPIIGLADGSVLSAPSEASGHAGVGDLYQPSKKSWKKTRAGVARYYAAGTLLNDGSVLIAGGCTDDCTVPSVTSAVRYLPGRRSYVDVSPMNIGRESASAVTLHDGRVLMQGGFASSGAAGAEIFTP